MLARLRSAAAAQVIRTYPSDDAFGAIEILPELHATSASGGLPEIVGGREFRTEAALMFDAARDQIRLAAEFLVDRVDNVREEDLEEALDSRSAIQFLTDDFRGTVAEGLVDAGLFDDGVDEGFAAKLRHDGPLDVIVPRNMPASHWWWALARGVEPDTGA